MTDKEHQYVAAIAECGSITKAAERLFISQPSLTQAIHRLEEEYGASFFIRGRGGLQLTNAGRAFLDAAERMERLYEKMLQDVGRAESHEGTLNLGITALQGGILLPEAFSSFRRRYPGVNLKLTENSSDKLEQLAYEQRLDLVILHRPFSRYELEYIPLHREEFYLAVSPKSPAYAELIYRPNESAPVNADFLRRQEFIMLTANQRVRQVSDIICARAGVTPRTRFSTTSFATALAMVDKGLGVTFVPASFSHFYSSRFQVAYFRFPAAWDARWEMVAAYSGNAPLSPVSLEFVRVIRECIQSMPEVFQ